MHVIAIGGSDAGISAALRARELDPSVEVTVVVADAYPNFSICGIPYYLSGDVTRWRNLAHRTIADLESTGMNLQLESMARRIEPDTRKLIVSDRDGREDVLSFDELVIGTGAVPVNPPIRGLSGPGALGVEDGVHLLHSMADTFALEQTIETHGPGSALIVGAGYIGLEMAEALVARGIRVIQMEQAGEVLPTVDPELGALVHNQLVDHGVEVLTSTSVTSVRLATQAEAGRLAVEGTGPSGDEVSRNVDLLLVVVGVRPESKLAASAGALLGHRGAIAVDRRMRTNLPHIYAAGDCVVTHHRLLGECYLPLGTTAHKQGRVAGENALGGDRVFAGSLGTQVLKVFDHAVARTGIRDDEAAGCGFISLTTGSEADDHKAYYPGSHRIAMRFTGDRETGRLLGMQLFGHKDSAVAKRIDIGAAAIFNDMTVEGMSDLDLSYTPPLGSPWDAVQTGAQQWVLARLRSSGRPMNHAPDAAQRRVRTVIEGLVKEGNSVVARSDGTSHKLFPVAAGPAEGESLREWVIREEATRTIEIGLGYGISALYICEGLLTNTGRGLHVAIDPHQATRFADCALQFLDDAGVLQLVEHHCEESQIALPLLLGAGREFDLAFVDGNHRFDGIFVDLVYLGRLVRPGGIIFVDDYQLPSVTRAVSFFISNMGWKIQEHSSADELHHWVVLRTAGEIEPRSYDHFVEF